MGFRNLVEKQVAQAFKQAGDLTKTVVISQKSSASFDFSSLVAEATEVSTLTLKAISLGQKKSGLTGNGSSPFVERLLVLSKEFKNPNIYDTVTVDGVVWNIVHPTSDDGYTTTIRITKEG